MSDCASGNIADTNWSKPVLTFQDTNVYIHGVIRSPGVAEQAKILSPVAEFEAASDATNQTALLATLGTLTVGGGIITNGGVVWICTNGTPTIALPDGSIASTTSGQFFVRSNGVWVLH